MSVPDELLARIEGLDSRLEFEDFMSLLSSYVQHSAPWDEQESMVAYLTALHGCVADYRLRAESEGVRVEPSWSLFARLICCGVPERLSSNSEWLDVDNTRIVTSRLDDSID